MVNEEELDWSRTEKLWAEYQKNTDSIECNIVFYFGVCIHRLGLGNDAG